MIGYMRVIFVVLLSAFFLKQGNSQTYAIGYEAGLYLYDVFGNPNDTRNDVAGWSIGNKLELSARKEIKEIPVRIGFGFQRQEHLYNSFYTTPVVTEHPSRTIDYTNYLTVSVGVMKTFKRLPSIPIMFNINSNFVAHRHLINEAERRFFISMDLGLIKQFGQNEIYFSGLFAPTPVFRQEANFIDNGQLIRFTTFVEVMGFNVGYRRILNR